MSSTLFKIFDNMVAVSPFRGDPAAFLRAEWEATPAVGKLADKLGFHRVFMAQLLDLHEVRKVRGKGLVVLSGEKNTISGHLYTLRKKGYKDLPDYRTVYTRLAGGWEPEDALTAPVFLTKTARNTIARRRAEKLDARESELEQYLFDKVKALGGYSRKVTWGGVRGAPDRVVMLGGRSVFVELKRPSGEYEVQEHQSREHTRMQETGGLDVRVVSTRAGIDALLHELKEA